MATTPPSADYRGYAQQLAKKYKLKYFVPQIQQESHFDPNARSPAGATGIAQIMPDTAKGWGVDPNNPRAALAAAARNMAKYTKQYGSERNALIAYNAGPGKVGSANLPAETRKYLEIITGAPVQPGSSNDTSTHATNTGVAGTTQDASSQRSVYDVLRTFDANTGGSSDSGIADTVKSIQAIKAPAAAGMQAGSMDAVGLTGNKDVPQAVAQMMQEADKIDAAQMPYLWGGGHGAGATGKPLSPLDCSGAVSRVIGIDPRVAADYMKWGDSGEGKNITIYAKGDHVLMKINGHFFGTSRANPGGGAGYIPASGVSKQYLSQFVARHPKGL